MFPDCSDFPFVFGNFGCITPTSVTVNETARFEIFFTVCCHTKHFHFTVNDAAIAEAKT